MLSPQVSPVIVLIHPCGRDGKTVKIKTTNKKSFRLLSDLRHRTALIRKLLAEDTRILKDFISSVQPGEDKTAGSIPLVLESKQKAELEKMVKSMRDLVKGVDSILYDTGSIKLTLVEEELEETATLGKKNVNGRQSSK